MAAFREPEGSDDRLRRRDAARVRRRPRGRYALALTAVLTLAGTIVLVAWSAGSGADRGGLAAARAVAWARAQQGTREVGTTNCSPAIDSWERHMGVRVPAAPPCRPWCGAFVHEAWLRAGVDLSSRIIDPNASYADAVAGVNGLKSVPIPSVRPGDIVFFALDPNMPAGHQASHEGLVIARPRGGRVRTVEGNVGHHVVVTRRGLRYVALAARVTRRPS